MSDRISLKRFLRCGKNDSVMLTVSITYPRRTLQLNQVQSPASKMFRNNTFLWLDVYVGSSGRNTFSNEWNKVHRTLRRLCAGLWDRPKKKPTKTSMYAVDPCRQLVSHWYELGRELGSTLPWMPGREENPVLLMITPGCPVYACGADGCITELSCPGLLLST